MTTDLRGVPLLDAVIGEIKAHPELHEQGKFATRTSCGTAFCVGGWAVVLAFGEGAIDWSGNDGDAWECWIPGDDGRPEPFGIGYLAQRLLGLSINDAVALFDGTNTLGDIVRIRDEIAGVTR